MRDEYDLTEFGRATSSTIEATQSSTVSVIGSAGFPALPGRSIASAGNSSQGTSRSQNPDDDAVPWIRTNERPDAVIASGT